MHNERTPDAGILAFLRRRIAIEALDERGALSTRQLAWLSAAGAAITAAGAIGSLWIANNLGAPAPVTPTATAIRNRDAWIVDVTDVPELPFNLRIPVDAGLDVPKTVNVIVTGLPGSASCVTTSFSYPDGTSSVESTYAVRDVADPRSAAPVPECPPGEPEHRRALVVHRDGPAR